MKKISPFGGLAPSWHAWAGGYGDGTYRYEKGRKIIVAVVVEAAVDYVKGSPPSVGNQTGQDRTGWRDRQTRETERETDRQDRQTERQTERQTDRETDRQRDREA